MYDNMLGEAHNELYGKLSAEYRRRLSLGLPCPEARYFSWPFAQIFVARNIKVLYCPIGKNACSSLKKLLVELSDIDDKAAVLSGDIHRNTDLGFTGIQLKDLTNEQIQEAFASPEYLRFAVLRDPLSRLLSAYWEKFVVNRTETPVLGDTLAIVAAIQGQKGMREADPLKGVSFYDFACYVTSQHPESLNAHWRPQYSYLEGVAYNRFYDVANLQELYAELGRRIGKPITAPSDNVTNSGVGKYISNAMHLLPEELLAHGNIAKESFFDDELGPRVAHYYAKDREMLTQCL